MSENKQSCAVNISMRDVGLSGFYMSPVDGKDQVVAKAINSGWWSFEQPLPAVMLNCLKAWPGTLFDVGANTGFYSLLIATSFVDVHIAAFEPDPSILDTLSNNILANNLGSRVDLHQVALSHTSGTAQLFVPLQGHGLVETSSSLEADFKSQHSEIVSVETRRLDDYIDHYSSVSLIKIDVEGHEKGVLQGGLSVIEKFRPIIIIELLDSSDYDYFNKLKNEMGYKSFALRDSSAIFEDEMSFDVTAWNHALVPAEKELDFRGLVQGLGLGVSG